MRYRGHLRVLTVVLTPFSPVAFYALSYKLGRLIPPDPTRSADDFRYVVAPFIAGCGLIFCGLALWCLPEVLRKLRKTFAVLFSMASDAVTCVREWIDAGYHLDDVAEHERTAEAARAERVGGALSVADERVGALSRAPVDDT